VNCGGAEEGGFILWNWDLIEGGFPLDDQISSAMISGGVEKGMFR